MINSLNNPTGPNHPINFGLRELFYQYGIVFTKSLLLNCQKTKKLSVITLKPTRQIHFISNHYIKLYML